MLIVYFVVDLLVLSAVTFKSSSTVGSDSLGGEFHAAVIGAVFGVSPCRLDTSWTQTLSQSPSHLLGSALSSSLAVPHALPVTLLRFVTTRLHLLFRRRDRLLQGRSGVLVTSSVTSSVAKLKPSSPSSLSSSLVSSRASPSQPSSSESPTEHPHPRCATPATGRCITPQEVPFLTADWSETFAHTY